MRNIIAVVALAATTLATPALARPHGTLEQRTAERVNSRTAMAGDMVVTSLRTVDNACTRLGMDTQVDEARFNQDSSVRYEENPRNNYDRWNNTGRFYRNDWNRDQRPWSHYGSGTEVIVDSETTGEREVICVPKQ